MNRYTKYLQGDDSLPGCPSRCERCGMNDEEIRSFPGDCRDHQKWLQNWSAENLARFRRQQLVIIILSVIATGLSLLHLRQRSTLTLPTAVDSADTVPDRTDENHDPQG